MGSIAVRAEPFRYRMKLDEIGGGRVIRPFRMGSETVPYGRRLTREQILSMGASNLTTLIGQNIDVWPRADEGLPPSTPVPPDRAERTDRHVVSLGFGRYKVYEGLLTDEPVTRSQAYALAGKPEPPKSDKER